MTYGSRRGAPRCLSSAPTSFGPTTSRSTVCRCAANATSGAAWWASPRWVLSRSKSLPCGGATSGCTACKVGGDWALSGRTQVRLGVGIYDFHNIEGRREDGPPPSGARAGTTPYLLSQYPTSARQKGNTLINLNDPTNTGAPVFGLASKFRPVNVTAGVTFAHFDPAIVGISADYVKNTAFDNADIRRRAGTDGVNDLAAKTTGLQLRAQVGALRLAERGNWQTFFALRKFERDAWLDAFTDTTWHLGGTNYKGFQVGGSYAIDRSTWLTLRYSSTRNLDDGRRFLAVPGDPTSVSGNLSSAPLKIDVLQLEVNSRF